jgi:GntR family transcriptional repressor for pyruvate dehydrogenase complex
VAAFAPILTVVAWPAGRDPAIAECRSRLVLVTAKSTQEKSRARERRRQTAGYFSPVSTRAAFEDVIRQIADLVSSGLVEEGEKLPSERRLAETMRVSRPTIRMAVKALAGAGVVKVLPGRGGGIQVASRWVPHDLTGLPVELDPDVVFDLLEARRAIEPRVARLAALRGSAEDFEAMEEALRLQEEHLDDHPKAIQADMLFHRAMWHAAKNARLERILVAVVRDMSTLFDLALRTARDRNVAVKINRATLEAVRRGDEDEIDFIMDRHMAYLEDITDDVLGSDQRRKMPAFLRQAV